MKAAVLYEAQTPLVIEELDIGEPGPGQVMVKMMASGVCHSDWHVVKGEWTHLPLPIILGHEGAGIVEATGPGVNNVERGDHVILAWRSQCGLCEMCQLGWPALCYDNQYPKQKPTLRQSGREINQMVGVGSFGSYQIVSEVAAIPIRQGHPVSSGIPHRLRRDHRRGRGDQYRSGRARERPPPSSGPGESALTSYKAAASRERRRSSPSTFSTTSSIWPGSSARHTQ